MRISGVNHVNIVARDMDETVRFYETVLGMKASKIPGAPDSFKGLWLYDQDEQPIIHVRNYDPERHATLESTGSIDHIALSCTGFDSMVRRCEELELKHKVNDKVLGDLRQVFVTDPNNVMIELNFPGD